MLLKSSSMIWPDENSFNLDNTHGPAFKWNYSRDLEAFFSRPHSGDGDLFVWGCLAFLGSDLFFKRITQWIYLITWLLIRIIWLSLLSISRSTGLLCMKEQVCLFSVLASVEPWLESYREVMFYSMQGLLWVVSNQPFSWFPWLQVLTSMFTTVTII